MMIRTLLVSLAAALALLLPAALPARAESGRPIVVVELYTSQGCSSCPAADAFLGDLIAKRDDILGLEFHVDYWDNLGWKDIFSSAASTARQRAYAKKLGLSYVFTPQMVIQGSDSEVGSDEMAVMTAIEEAHAKAGERFDIALSRTPGGGLTVSLPAAPHGGTPATVWLINFDRGHVTDVTAGENNGRQMKNNHIVRAHQAVGAWTGAAMEIALSADQATGGTDAEGCAILVQEGDFGPIIAARAMWLDSEG
jgi:hypothetical protein